MSQDWNGLDLQTEFSEQLSDTSTAFKTKVLSWINSIQNDIVSRHDWDFMLVKGKKVLTVGSENQDVSLGKPSAATVAAASGGSLTADSTYNVIVTFFEGTTNVESIAGTTSADVTPTGANLTISVSAIPTSADPLVTARKIYIIKDGGAALFSQTISDNTTTTASITADSTSLLEPPDYSHIRKFKGDPFIEGKRILTFTPIEQMRLLHQGTWSNGTPTKWSVENQTNLSNNILMYSPPSAADTLSFNYYRRPNRIFAVNTSQPNIPPELKEALEAGVIWRGYRYRDRDGERVKKLDYEDALAEAISKYGTSVDAQEVVRDTFGHDGDVIGA